MAKKTFNEVGDMEDKVTWNAAGTRKWRMTYTLLEVKPSWRKAKAQATSKKKGSEKAVTESKPKPATKAKSKKATKPKKATKAKTKSKATKAKSKK